MKITRLDVARMAGVSPSVVSYVTNGGPRPVSASARARVEAAIDALGYRPNALANAFRDGRSSSVGLLIPGPLNPFYAEMAQVIETELVRHGYLLSMAISTFNAGRDEVQLRSFDDRRMAGVIVASGAVPSSLDLQEWSIPRVVLDDVPGLDTPSVFTDDFYDAGRAVDHLQMHGHEVIGCIAGPAVWRDCALRVDAWRARQEMAGLPADRELVAYSDVSEQGGSMALRILLSDESYRSSRRRQKPTAVFVNSDVQALGALRACHELGIRIPDDLAIVSFDGVRYGLFSNPRLTTMRRPLQEIVRTAVSLLLGDARDDSDGQPAAPIRVALRGNMLIGESCGCVPAISWHGGMMS
ncbi:LacI family DNA-binding transcriptional regulator [Jiangella alkaliphila]|uniref:Transcriptional regulator, LacI family n=1 Tax=Jiangella alkaliphila TaxID=419479 RepID=A0A1H2LDP1_9ACTN|nr:LacI family DNA-binding transcriptional regulator [Jiangella alkaliphila]SDU79160.1 transcriptional regulator, LacI family [Jiangella alkaliphila]